MSIIIMWWKYYVNVRKHIHKVLEIHGEDVNDGVCEKPKENSSNLISVSIKIDEYNQLIKSYLKSSV